MHSGGRSSEATAHDHATARFDYASCGAVVLCLLVATFRAARISLSHDEAITYLSFVRPGAAAVFGGYIANNHVLHSLFAVFSTALFGPGVLSFRVPALMGTALVLAVLRRGALRSGSPPWVATIAVLAVGLNPYLLDYFAMARGYSLATGFALTALYAASSPAFRLRPLACAPMAGVFAGLAVATVPSFAVFAAALGAVLVGAGRRKPAAGGAIVYSLAALATAAAILHRPLAHARRSDFSIGKESFLESATALRDVLLRTDGLDVVPHRVATALLLVLTAALIASTRRRGLLVLAVAAVEIVLHGLILPMSGFLYPLPRIALDLVVWIPAAAAWSPSRRGWNGGVLIVLTAFNLLHAPSEVFADFRYDADTTAAYEWLESKAKDRNAEIRVWSDWLIAPTLNALRAMDDRPFMNALPEEAMPNAAYDYFLLLPGRGESEADALLRTERRFPRSGLTIRVPK